MKILIVGAGAREDAIGSSLWRNEVGSLHFAPGTKGTLGYGSNTPVELDKPEEVLRIAEYLEVDFTVVGPEVPLAAGIVDLFHSKGKAIFGPTRAAAQLEASKSFALQVMDRAHVPHPDSLVFTNPGAVLTFFRKYGNRVAVKTDGLAAGKGTFICETEHEVLAAAKRCAELSPGKPIIVQEFLEGREVSVFCFTDGWNISSLVAACDYKRVGEGDTGPMTGGMGSYCWPEFWTEDLENWVRNHILLPVIRQMHFGETPFQGVLYAGLMVCKEFLEGESVPILAKVLEFNCRLGDPEAQVILPLLKTDLLEIMQACTKEQLNLVEVRWRKDMAAVGVVIASDGYPQKSVKGNIEGLEKLESNILVFHGGESGRMITLVMLAPTLEHATEKVYENLQRLQLTEAFYRRDIGIQAVSAI